jgi:hypothetical protein
MPDWNKLVRARLGKLGLPPVEKEAIISELAAHLEDLYQEQLANGVSEVQAVQHVITENSNWHLLARNIQRAKRTEPIMNDRTKQIWIPGVLGLVVSLGWMILLQALGSWMHTSTKYPGMALFPNIVWLASLPFIGAASGYLSKRAGSTRSVCIAAAIFPSIAMSLVWVLVLAVVLVRKLPIENIGFSSGFAHAVIIPGIALLVGAAPFLRSGKFDGSRMPS